MLYADPLLLATEGAIPLSNDGQLSEPLAIATIGHISLIFIVITGTKYRPVTISIIQTRPITVSQRIC